MKFNHYSIYKNENEEWCLTSSEGENDKYTYKTKKEALDASKIIAKGGKIIIVYSAKGEINEVLGLKYKKPIRFVRTKSKLKSDDINIAIAKAMEEKMVKDNYVY